MFLFGIFPGTIQNDHTLTHLTWIAKRVGLTKNTGDFCKRWRRSRIDAWRFSNSFSVRPTGTHRKKAKSNEHVEQFPLLLPINQHRSQSGGNPQRLFVTKRKPMSTITIATTKFTMNSCSHNHSFLFDQAECSPMTTVPSNHHLIPINIKSHLQPQCCPPRRVLLPTNTCSAYLSSSSLLLRLTCDWCLDRLLFSQ